MTEPAAMKELVAAIRRGDADAVRALVAGAPSLLSAHDPECFGATALIHAANCDDREVVDVLLDAGADIDERSDWWAGSFGALDSAGDDLSEHLLERGATLTPHAAARLGMAGALRAMIEADPAVVHLRGGDGQFPLHFARTAEIADLLLDAGADIDARDIDHESTAAQWLATARPGVAAYLVARGCETDPFLLAIIGDSQRLEGALAADPDDIDVRVTPERFPTRGERAAEHIYAYTIGSGFTLLHAAAAADRPEVVSWLVARGCDAGARGGYD
ncbi:MAG: ankyrin repeat domain-containing protein, partial [Longimicrobiales bacterium]